MTFSNPYNCSSVSQRESIPPNGSLHVSLLLMWCRPSVQKMLQYKLPQNTMFLGNRSTFMWLSRVLPVGLNATGTCHINVAPG